MAMAGYLDIHQKDVFIRIYTDGSGPENFEKQRPFAYIEFNHQAYTIAGSANELQRRLLDLDVNPEPVLAEWNRAENGLAKY